MWIWGLYYRGGGFDKIIQLIILVTNRRWYLIIGLVKENGLDMGLNGPWIKKIMRLQRGSCSPSFCLKWPLNSVFGDEVEKSRIHHFLWTKFHSKIADSRWDFVKLRSWNRGLDWGSLDLLFCSWIFIFFLLFRGLVIYSYFCRYR